MKPPKKVRGRGAAPGNTLARRGTANRVMITVRVDPATPARLKAAARAAGVRGIGALLDH